MLGGNFAALSLLWCCYSCSCCIPRLTLSNLPATALKPLSVSGIHNFQRFASSFFGVLCHNRQCFCICSFVFFLYIYFLGFLLWLIKLIRELVVHGNPMFGLLRLCSLEFSILHWFALVYGGIYHNTEAIIIIILNVK